MRKYWAIYKVSFINTLSYRAPILIWRTTDLLTLVVIVAFWLAAKAPENIAGYSRGQLVFYYLIAMLITPMMSWFPAWGIKKEITNGEIAATVITKPLSYYWYKFFQEFGWHTVSPIFGFVIFAVATWLLRSQLDWIINPYQLITFVLGIGLAAWLTFCISYCLGLVAFWFLEVEGISHLYWIGTFIFGGQIVPVSFFTGALQTVVKLMPFRYVFSFPLEIFFGRLSPADLIFGFGMQIIWIISLSLLSAQLWRRGLKVYTSYGS